MPELKIWVNDRVYSDLQRWYKEVHSTLQDPENIEGYTFDYFLGNWVQSQIAGCIRLLDEKCKA